MTGNGIETLMNLQQDAKEIRETPLSSHELGRIGDRTEQIDGALPDIELRGGIANEERITELLSMVLQRRHTDATGTLLISAGDIVKLSSGLGICLPTEHGNPALFSSGFADLARVLERNWKNRFSRYALGVLLSFWHRMPQSESVIHEIERFVRRGLNESRGSKWQNSLIDQICSRNGAAQLADRVISDGLDPIEYMRQMGIPVALSGRSFFSATWLEYFKRVHVLRPESVRQYAMIIGSFENPDDRKLAMAELVLGTHDLSGDDRHAIYHVAKEHVGDANLYAAWTLSELAGPEDRERVSVALRIMRGWVNKEVIDAFFDVVSADARRREFWMPYVRSIEDIKILCDRWTVRKLNKRGPRIAEYLSDRTILSERGPAAIVIRTESHVLVEFSELGNAFYAYTRTENLDRLLRSASIKDTTRLKVTHMRTISRTETEGRFIHRAGWEAKLRTWLRIVARLQRD